MQDPEWGEEFEFDCNKEDQYVNVCVWCRVQTNRNSKPLPVPGRGEGGAKLTPPNDELPFYNVTTKIGYVSTIPAPRARNLFMLTFCPN
ncbi:hypothetical protein DPMN_115654 [Dreissena polymorpha]|uniref:C2 domain-containing protein n=1 Tax=Dreissena polymorpha TaxID=45954 RepID=A0A9D4QTY7_DREPO|nr:hypothetical protein DPMN_115654 [Dreissena polymorpha]